MIRTVRFYGIRSRYLTAISWCSLEHSLYKPEPSRKALGQANNFGHSVRGVVVIAGLLVSLLSSWAATAANTASRPVQIAAAASLRVVWQDLTDVLPADIPATDLRISFASTGLLQVQIENGAPFDLFLAADQQSPEKLVSLGLARGESILYASGRLVLVTGKSTTDKLASVLDELETDQRGKTSPRLAIANPRHAPYGRASVDWLQSQALWPWPGDALLLGENTAQALQFVHSGAVDYAILPAALSDSIDDAFSVFKLPTDQYQAINHHSVVMRDAPPLADVIADWLLSPAAQAVFANYGLERSAQ